MNKRPYRIVVLGSTGSIGRNAVEVVSALGAEYQIVGLAANTDWRTLAEQARFCKVEAVALADATNRADLKNAAGASVRIHAGGNALVELLDAVDCDCVVAAVVGAAGLKPVLKAAESGCRLALANKEPMVAAGELITAAAKRGGAEIIPIDSEHSAVLQAMTSGAPGEIRRVVLTASGGPFRTWPAEQMRNATLEDALRHPTWNMGPKNTIDSATMMNKALEVIEAQWLFGLDPECIEVLVHPESIVHALVEFVDGSVIAQMGAPDMRLPIQYALTYPQRLTCPARRLDLATLGRLRFEATDEERFPSLRMAYEVARAGGVAGAVFNAANEAAVELFQAGEIRFTAIFELIEAVLSRHEPVVDPTLDDVLRADTWARGEVARCLTC